MAHRMAWLTVTMNEFRDHICCLKSLQYLQSGNIELSNVYFCVSSEDFLPTIVSHGPSAIAQLFYNGQSDDCWSSNFFVSTEAVWATRYEGRRCVKDRQRPWIIHALQAILHQQVQRWTCRWYAELTEVLGMVYFEL